MGDEKIIVNIDNNSRIYQIVATLLAIGAVGMIAWALAENGWLELASTGLTMFGFQLTKLMFASGLLKMPTGNNQSFKGTQSLLKTMAQEFRQWQANSPVWRLALLAIAYTAGFMIARLVVSWALGIFTNIWVAGAVAALLGSLIIFPQLFSNAWKGISGKIQTKPETNAVVIEEVVVEETAETTESDKE